MIVNESESVQVGLVDEHSLGDICIVPASSLSVASFVFYCGMSSVLDKGSFDLKVLVQ